MTDPATRMDVAAIHRIVVDGWLTTMREHKDRCDRAIAQLSDAQLHATIAPGANSVAVLMRHVAGSLSSRFTAFLTSDGEKAGRDRDREFVDDRLARAAQLTRWNEGWGLAVGAIRGLTAEDLGRVITIRSELHSVPRAVERAISHVAYHTGQILLCARLIAEREPRGKWNWVTVRPGASGAYNDAMRAAFESSQGG